MQSVAYALNVMVASYAGHFLSSPCMKIVLRSAADSLRFRISESQYATVYNWIYIWT